MPSKSKYKLSDRQLTEEEEAALRYTCRICSEPFIEFKSLIGHSATQHGPDIKHFCSYAQYGICMYTEKSVNNMKVHTNTHTRNKPYDCNKHRCSWKFGDPSSLNRHGKTQHKIEGSSTPTPTDTSSAPRSKHHAGRISRRRLRTVDRAPKSKRQEIHFLPPTTPHSSSTSSAQPRPPFSQSWIESSEPTYRSRDADGGSQAPTFDRTSSLDPVPSLNAARSVHPQSFVADLPPSSPNTDCISVFLQEGTNPDIWRYATIF